MKYTFTFKDINTQQISYFTTESTSTIAEFVENIKICMYTLPSMYVNKTFDIVEAGHYNNSNGFAPELADKIDLMYDNNDTLEKIYGNTWKNTTFYIRITNDN